MLILKQNAANSVPVPPAGKGTIFLDDSDTLSVKTSDGNVETFPTVAASNTQVVFIDGTSLSGDADFIWNKNTNVLTITGNVSATGVKTDNLYYANGNPWDLQQAGGSNTQIQFNDADSFGGSAAFTFNNTSNLVTVAANLNANNLNATTHITSGNVWANSGTIGAAHFTGEAGNLSNIQGANVSGGVATAATVTTAAQPNITSVGNLTSLGMSGHIIPTADATYDLGNATNTFRDLYLSGSSLKIGGGTITANATAVIITNPVGGQVVVGGTSIANAAAIVNGNSNVVVSANGNVTTSVAGNANIFTVTGTGANISGTLNATGNANVGNIGATQGVFTNVSGNGSSLSSLTGGNVTGQVANALVAGTVYTAAQPNITSVGTLTSATVTGNVTAGNVYANTGTIGASLLTGTLTTASQPNITSVGTLSSLTVTGTATAGHLSGEAGNISNVQGANVSGAVSSATTAGTVTTASQPNITSVGTLTSLGVSGTITAANVTANTGVFTGNGNGLSSLQGANLTGTIATGVLGNSTLYVGTTSIALNRSSGSQSLTGITSIDGYASTVSTASQPNITSVGTLTSLSVTGTVSGGNLSTSGVLTVTGTGVSSIAGNLDMTSNTIINLANPTNDQDAATKYYVDSVAQGLHVHDSCYVATTGTLDAATGGTVAYNNGSSGVGATLTVTGGTYTTIDGGNVQTVGTRILVKNEANAAWNGIYTYTSTTVLTRATDFDTSAEAAGGDFLFVTSGTVNADTGWVQTTDNPTLGTSNIVFSQFSGAGTYSAGTGLTLTGTVFSITNTAVSAASYGNGDRVASFTVNAQGQLTAASNVVIAANAANLTGTTLATSIVTSSLTAVGTVTTGVWNNNIGSSATFAAGLSGANLASITGGNVTGQVGNALVSGTVYTAAQPNITSVGTLTSLAVTGNVSAANFVGALANGNSTVTIPAAAGNVNVSVNGTANVLVVTATGANIAGTLNATGNANVGNIGGTNGVFTTVAGTLSTAAQPNITSVGTLTSLGVSGAVTASTLVSNVATGTAPLTVTSTTQVANLNVATAGTAGTVTTAAQPNITSVGTLTSLGVSGTITAPNFTANTGVFTGNGNGLSSLQGANFTGTINSTVLGNSTLYVGTTAIALNRGTGAQSLTGITSIDGYAATVSTAAQPNITSTGTLTSLTVSGNITAQSSVTVTNNVVHSVATGISANGSTQGTATALTKDINVVATVSASQGVVLPTAVAGMRITVMNTSATAVTVYPATGGAINAAAANAGYTLAAGGRLDFIATSTTQWYTLAATYA